MRKGVRAFHMQSTGENRGIDGEAGGQKQDYGARSLWWERRLKYRVNLGSRGNAPEGCCEQKDCGGDLVSNASRKYRFEKKRFRRNQGNCKTSEKKWVGGGVERGLASRAQAVYRKDQPRSLQSEN